MPDGMSLPRFSGTEPSGVTAHEVVRRIPGISFRVLSPPGVHARWYVATCSVGLCYVEYSSVKCLIRASDGVVTGHDEVPGERWERTSSITEQPQQANPAKALAAYD